MSAATELELRLRKIKILREHYSSFNIFLRDAMAFLGFKTTWAQEDIGNFLQFGPQWLMIQAQRGQAKTTITACFAVWSLLHNTQCRVLIVSAGGKLASQISTLITRLILNMPQLECIRPDRNAGDRVSVEAFDLHHSIKRVDKSPSVACIGITGNLDGNRADILIADDIESSKNSLTAAMRQALLQLMHEFSSIAGALGRVIYLGTPKSTESVYNTLPSQGYTVRIWPGRFPTLDQQPRYRGMLAPSITSKVQENPALMMGGGALGDQGQPLDPQIHPEEYLQRKENSSKAYFQLAHMLNTALMDADLFPLKLEQCIVMPLNERLPISVQRGMTQAAVRNFSVLGFDFQMMSPHSISEETAKEEASVFYIDPAGGGANGDETSWVHLSALNSNLFVRDWGGIPGGYDQARLSTLAKTILRCNPKEVSIEKNFGYGAFKEVFIPVLRRMYDEWNAKNTLRREMPAITEDFVTGQKELRIIDTIEPIIGRGSLIFNETRMKDEARTVAQYDESKQLLYSLPFQLARMTRTRGCLIHDDRADALEGACRKFQASVARDQEKAGEAARAAELLKWMKDPLGHGRYSVPDNRKNSALGRRRYS